MRKSCFIVLFIALFLGCKENKTMPITELNPDNLSDAVLVDVRTPEEYAEGHLNNSNNIDWYDSDFSEKIQLLSKDQKIYVYCKKGGRSAKAAQLMDSLGYTKVVDLTGGYDAWLAKQN